MSYQYVKPKVFTNCCIDNCDRLFEVPTYKAIGNNLCPNHNAIRRKHKIPISTFMDLMNTPHCGICGATNVKFVLDHDHDTNSVREKLCYRCNSLLGQALDDKKILQAAIEYLERHE